MYYRALEELKRGDHVALLEKPNKVGKCNDPAHPNYLGVLSVGVAENKKFKSDLVTPVEDYVTSMADKSKTREEVAEEVIVKYTSEAKTLEVMSAEDLKDFIERSSKNVETEAKKKDILVDHIKPNEED